MNKMKEIISFLASIGAKEGKPTFHNLEKTWLTMRMVPVFISKKKKRIRVTPTISPSIVYKTNSGLGKTEFNFISFLN